MKLSSLQESISDYERITNETFEIPSNCAIKILSTNEWMIWKLGLRNEVPFFYIDQCYARSFSAFVPFIKEVCKSAGIEWIATSTQRPKAHYRKWNMELVNEYDFENRHYHTLKSHISNLK